jgi:Ca2+-binding EF-hand superfamily protein
MLGELQKEKMRKVFDIWDANGDGFLQKDDWVLIQQRHAASLGIGAETPQFKSMGALFNGIWEVLRAVADKNRDDRISPDEFLAYAEDVYGNVKEVGYQQIPERERAMFEAIMQWGDRDQDGKIGLDDYSGWLTAWLGRDAGDRAKEAFQRLDLDGDGYISAEEMRSIIAQYILSNDSNAPGNWLFG